MEFGAFALSWELLLTVATGYAGYFVANVGVRSHHKTIDVTFSTVVYGFFGTAAYLRLISLDRPIWIAVLGAFASAMVAGGLWSGFLRERFTKLLRKLRISHNDDLPSALASMFADKGTVATQLSVRLQSGVWLMCDDLDKFRNAPGGPCVLGQAGDVLMYVTHHRDPNGDYEACEVDVAGWGLELTYLPASQVTRIDLRKLPISS
jgi:hypothetical protein